MGERTRDGFTAASLFSFFVFFGVISCTTFISAAWEVTTRTRVTQLLTSYGS